MSGLKSEKLEVRVEPGLLKLVREAAGDVPVSVWVRRAIEERLARVTPPDDLMRVRGEVRAAREGKVAHVPMSDGTGLRSQDLAPVDPVLKEAPLAAAERRGCRRHPDAGVTADGWCREPGCSARPSS